MPDIASLIEHTLLAPEAVRADFEHLVEEAVESALFGVCVPSARVAEVRSSINRRGASVKLVTVLAFPNGAVPTAIKAAETRVAVEDGADELDLVVNIGWVRDGEIERCRDEIGAVVQAAKGLPLKVILEVGLLTDDEKRAIGRAAIEAGAKFLKTSTGINGRGGATIHDVRLLRQIAGPDRFVKAAGGIRTRADALAMIEAGANRIGTSAGPRIATPGDLT